MELNRICSTSKVVSTDPPYYDNVGYADSVGLLLRLAASFDYGQSSPNLFATTSRTQGTKNLVATPYRHGSKEKAETFFLQGMTQAR